MKWIFWILFIVNLFLMILYLFGAEELENTKEFYKLLEADNEAISNINTLQSIIKSVQNTACIIYLGLAVLYAVIAWLFDKYKEIYTPDRILLTSIIGGIVGYFFISYKIDNIIIVGGYTGADVGILIGGIIGFVSKINFDNNS